MIKRFGLLDLKIVCHVGKCLILMTMRLDPLLSSKSGLVVSWEVGHYGLVDRIEERRQS